MADLKTDYKDDVLDTSVNEERKYEMSENSDGTVSLKDVTKYLQVGDIFSADILNQIVAKITTDVVDALADVLANTEDGVLVGANAVKELKNTLQSAIDTKVTNSFTANMVLCSSNSGKVSASPIKKTELGCLDGVTSNIQTQLDGKVTNNFAPDCALYSDANGRIVASGAVSSTELGHLNGVTSNIQTQLNAKLPKAGGTLTGKLTTQQVENSTSYVIGADKNSYSTAPFVASAPYSSNTASRAGYGFHNHGLNGTFLYLETNGDLKKADNDGTFHKIMDSGHFSVSGTTLNITL